jgi:hypothetical protein
MAKSLNGKTFVVGKPKKTTQGNGQHSRPTGDKKPYRGQGKR